jgi:hypothetical protein
VTDHYDVLGLRPLSESLSDEGFGLQNDLDYPVAVVTINGWDLRWIVLDAMKVKRPDFDLFEPSDTEFLGIHEIEAATGQWLGHPDPELVVDGHAAVLTCSCTAFGCGGMAARIELTPDTVTWSDFVDCSGTPYPVRMFRFERGQYEREIASLGPT